MRLITNKIVKYHVSNDTIIEFENAILSDSKVKPAQTIHLKWFRILFFIYRLFRNLGFSTIRTTKKRYMSNPLLDKKHLFTVMMGLDIYKYRPYGLYTTHNRSIYLFDAWPHDFDKIVNFVEVFKIDFIFVSASQSAKILDGIFGNRIIVSWIPEGINPQEYKFNSFEDKSIDVLALGRKYDLYHERILPYFEKNNRVYLYEKVKGELIFPTREEFIDGMAKSKISICVPSNITHPERSGNIETMTIRYLQSMVSKCLIVGHAPKEMIDLFGYNPIIEINMSDPVGQIEAILKDFDTYIPLIEKNYQQVLQHHTWSNRWNQMKNIWSNQSK